MKYELVKKNDILRIIDLMREYQIEIACESNNENEVENRLKLYQSDKAYSLYIIKNEEIELGFCVLKNAEEKYVERIYIKREYRISLLQREITKWLLRRISR